MDTAQPAPRPIDRNVMLLSVFLMLALAALFTVRPWRRSKVAWSSDLAGALSAAKSNHQPIFVEVYATWCGPCRQMERDTFSDKEVGQKMSGLTSVRLDYDDPAQRKEAEKWGEVVLPEHVLLHADGTPQAIAFGYLTPDELTGWLAKHEASGR